VISGSTSNTEPGSVIGAFGLDRAGSRGLAMLYSLPQPQKADRFVLLPEAMRIGAASVRKSDSK
jgi:hypothetical protein